MIYCNNFFVVINMAGVGGVPSLIRMKYYNRLDVQCAG